MQTSVNYTLHLNQVSRSFAFCIRELPSPEQQWVGLSYLLCRLADTIEDYPWASSQSQSLAFEGFIQFFYKNPSPEQVETWRQSFPQTALTKGERALLKDSAKLFFDYHQLPDEPRLDLQHSIVSMVQGMKSFQTSFRSKEKFQLQSLQHLDQYCFFVAGLVGELLTKLMSLAQKTYQPSGEDFRRAIHFGLFLQKVNILKDWCADKAEGRSFVRDPASLLPSLLRHAREVLLYIENLPPALEAYRRFCSWSFFIGLATLPYSCKSWTTSTTSKMPRFKALMIIEKVKRIGSCNKKLRALYTQMASFLESHPASSLEVFSGVQHLGGEQLLTLESLQRLYLGRLTGEDFFSLGLAPSSLKVNP